MRSCRTCLREKSTKDFSRKQRGFEGLNLDCKTCVAAASKARRDANYNDYRTKEIVRAIRRHGLTVDRFLEIWGDQGGLCPVCMERLTMKTFAVDHDHSCCSGTWSCGQCVRGILHRKCNGALGILLDSPELCERAANYLRGLPHPNS